MGHPHKHPRDRYGFKLETLTSEIAALMDQGLSDDEIVKRKYLRHTVHTARHQMKKARAKYPNGYSAPHAATVAPSAPSPADDPYWDKFGFRKSAKSAKVAIMVEAGSDGGEIARILKVSKQLVNQVRRKVVAHLATVKAALPVPLPPQGPTPLVPQRKRKLNGHDPRPHVPVPMVEVVLHDGNGREVPIFASPDVFPHIYQHVLRKMGMG